MRNVLGNIYTVREKKIMWRRTSDVFLKHYLNGGRRSREDGRGRQGEKEREEKNLREWDS